MPAYANYNAVYEKSLTDSGDNPIYAQIYLLVNLDNDTVIFEKNADKQAAPASLTKIMTATVVLENCKDLDEEVEASYEAIHLLDGTGSSIVGLEPGEKMSIKNLLYCLLVRSGNDAANVLAMHVGGSIEGFVKMMNDKAAARLQEYALCECPWARRPEPLHHRARPDDDNKARADPAVFFGDNFDYNI